MDQLSRWLEREGLGVGELTDEQAEGFAPRRARRAGDVGVAAERGAAARVPARARGGADAGAGGRDGPVEELLEDYRRYLLVERGLAEHTVVDAMCRPRGCSWLGGRARTGWGWSGCRAADVSSFLARECPKRSVSGARDLVVRAAVVSALPAPGRADRGAVGVGGPVGRRSARSHAAARA